MTTNAVPAEAPPTPELDKQKKARDEGHSEAIGEFLDWLQNERGVVLAYYPDDNDWLRPLYKDGGIQGWLAEYFGIDLDKTEAERRALLDYIRGRDGEATR